MRVLIAGCGDVGTLLGQLLSQQGHHVFGLRRNVDALPAAIIPIVGDLSDKESLNAIPKNLDLVYYTASANERTEESYRKIYVDGLINVLSQCRSGSPTLRHVFFTSSTSVYGQLDGSEVNEDSQTSPTSFTGRIILEGEAHLAQFPVSSTAVRFSGIYGPGRAYLIKSLTNGTASLKQNDTYTNRIHRTDCAGFLAHLATLEKPLPTYIATDSEPAPYNEVILFIATQLGLTAPKEANRIVVTNKRCSNRRLLESGYVLRYPSYKIGYKMLIASLQN